MGLQQIHHDGCRDGKQGDGYNADAYYHQGEMAEEEGILRKRKAAIEKR